MSGSIQLERPSALTESIRAIPKRGALAAQTLSSDPTLPRRSRVWAAPGLLGAALTMVMVCGCAHPDSPLGSTRPFLFGQDTFAYANELVWVYTNDAATGQTRHHYRQPRPTYTHHCFAMVRSARQFFQHARFDPAQPEVDDQTYRHLIRKVVSANPRQRRTTGTEIVVPGFASLYEFSLAKKALLQAECGSAWHSYFQRGHWRMVFPLSRNHQALSIRQLMDSLDQNLPPLLHLVRFPQLSINHAVLLFDYRASPNKVVFKVYDPNLPQAPAELSYDVAERRCHYPANTYFPGGRVDLYQVYHRWNY